MEAILEKLVRSPKFLGYVDELNEVRRKETAARQRFRETLDEDVRAEFINGEVMTQISSRDRHMLSVDYIAALVKLFVRSQKRGAVRVEQALTEFPRNDYAPDICFWSTAKSVHFTGETTHYPVPDFICEVLSPSTELRDRGVKFEDYAAHGVSEYWIVDAHRGIIEQYIARDGVYKLAGTFSDGSIRSSVIAGFEMPVAAAFDDETNLEAQRKFLAL